MGNVKTEWQTGWISGQLQIYLVASLDSICLNKHNFFPGLKGLYWIFQVVWVNWRFGGNGWFKRENYYVSPYWEESDFYDQLVFFHFLSYYNINHLSIC